jgi:CBS domain-containing protein
MDNAAAADSVARTRLTKTPMRRQAGDGEENHMLVREIMTKKVFTLQPDRKVMVAGDIMEWAKVRHVPVVDAEERVVGIVSRTDLLRASLPDSADADARFESHRHLASLLVKDLMSTPSASTRAQPCRPRRD